MFISFIKIMTIKRLVPTPGEKRIPGLGKITAIAVPVLMILINSLFLLYLYNLVAILYNSK